MKGNASKASFGVIIILLGCLLLAKNAGILEDFRFDGWWTLFIIVPCLVSIITNGIRLPNVFGLLIGGYLLAQQQDWIPMEYMEKYFWAGLLIIFGLWVLLGSFGSGRVFLSKVSGGGAGDFSENPDYVSIFSGNEVRNACPTLKSAKLTAVFGGLEVDFSDAVPSGDIRFEAAAIFGGIDLIAPKNANIVVKGIPIFGGCSNTASKPIDPSLPTITIEAAAVFGGVDVK